MTVGETHTPEITFTDDNGVLYNPDTVSVQVLSPAGTVTGPAVVNPSTGVFQTTFPLTAQGVWRFEFTGTGPSGSIVVEGSYVCVMAAVA